MTQSDEEDAWMFAEPGICVLGGLGPRHLRNPPSSLTKKRSTVGRALPKVTSPSLSRARGHCSRPYLQKYYTSIDTSISTT